jgi:hypothetical protein
VLVRLALGELDEALAACGRAPGDLVVGGTNLRAETFVFLSLRLEDEGKIQQALQALSKAGKADPRRKKDLEPRLGRLQAKAQAHLKQQQVRCAWLTLTVRNLRVALDCQDCQNIAPLFRSKKSPPPRKEDTQPTCSLLSLTRTRL